MAIRNPYFKTTQGLPFELMFSNALTASGVTHSYDSASSSALAVGVSMIFKAEADNNGSVSLDTATTPIAAATRKNRLNLAYIDNIVGSVRNLKTSTGFDGASVKVTNKVYAAPTAQVARVTGTGTAVTSHTLVFKVIETTPGSIPLPTWDYTQSLAAGEAAAWTAIVGRINDKKEGEFFTATALSAGAVITSTDYRRTFKLAVVSNVSKANPDPSPVTYAYTVNTNPFQGNGTYEQVVDLFTEFNTRRGVMQYSNDGGLTNGSDYGTVSLPSFVTSSSTFDLVTFEVLDFEASPTPLHQQEYKKTIIVACTAGTGAALAALFA